jgi:UDP-N-acetyl-D-glucosamine/UDP-N-acetyl-D-galactosamine dehydrogenase
VYNELCDFGVDVAIYDPWVAKEEFKSEYGIELLSDLTDLNYQGVILAVGHNEFLEIDFTHLKNSNTVIFDTKGFIDRSHVDARL